MPELPEVETVRRGLAPALEGARIVSLEQRRPDLRWPLPERFAERMAGRSVLSLGRRAKYLLGHLDDGACLIMHLGMSGRFTLMGPGRSVEPGAFYDARPRNPAHDHVVFHLEGGARLTYNDARRFGFMALHEGADASPHLAGLGLEPLDLDPADLACAFAGRRTSLKAALMDQRLIAGLGNIYVCEALHRARLSPLRAAASVAVASGRPGARALRLASAIRTVLAEAVEAGGSTLRDHAGADGVPGAFQHRFAVYDRAGEPCPAPGCSGTVSRIVQGARSTFYCPVCQT